MTIDEATRLIRVAIRDIRQGGNEKRANDVESAFQLLIRQAGDDARRAALDTAARVIREL